MITVDDKSIPKPKANWTEVEGQASLGNSWSLNAIYNGVDLNVLKLINTCSSAKDTWKNLEVAYEGTSKVKTSRLQLLTSKFESLRMVEEETIGEFNVRVLDIANESVTPQKFR